NHKFERDRYKRFKVTKGIFPRNRKLNFIMFTFRDPKRVNKFIRQLNIAEALVKSLEKVETRKFLEFAIRYPGRTQKECILATSIQQPYFTTMFEPLIKAGVVIVEEHPTDPRANAYFIDLERLEEKLLIIKKIGANVPTVTR